MDFFEQPGKAKPGDGTGAQAMPRPAQGIPTTAESRRWWKVFCRDVVHTDRFLEVLVNRDRVVLVGPPGEAAVLSAQGVRKLSSALRNAAEQARK